MNEIVTALADGGLTIGLIAYLIYSDNTYNKTMMEMLNKMQSSIDVIKLLLEKEVDKK